MIRPGKSAENGADGAFMNAGHKIATIDVAAFEYVLVIRYTC